MRKKLDQVDTDLNLQKQIVTALMEKNKSKKETLNSLNKNNLQLSYEIEELEDRIK